MKPDKKLFSITSLIVMALMTLTGCASDQGDPIGSPEAAYGEYLDLTKKSASLQQLANYWDREAREMFSRTDNSSGNYIAIETFESSLRYPRLFVEAPATPQAIEVTPDSSCMLLVGPATDGGVLALSVLMKKHGNAWQHSELFAHYPESGAPEPERPSCEAPKPFSG